jgi:hypothetical protein
MMDCGNLICKGFLDFSLAKKASAGRSDYAEKKPGYY